MGIPDNYDLWKAHDDEMEKALERLPVCCECDEPIQDDTLYVFDNNPICKSCLELHHEMSVEDFIE